MCVDGPCSTSERVAKKAVLLCSICDNAESLPLRIPMMINDDPVKCLFSLSSDCLSSGSKQWK